jgi:DNA-directed RNA polymerase subunit RPC12/RpoP
MADVVFNCMFCNEALIVDEKGVGLEVPCPYCLHKMEIPADAERVEDPDSINEIEAPKSRVRGEADPANSGTGPAASKSSASTGGGATGVGAGGPGGVSPENTESVLTLLGSLLEDREKEDPTPSREGPGKPAVGSPDKKILQAVGDLKLRIDDLQLACQDAEQKADILSGENTKLRHRVEDEEHEREELTAKLADHTLFAAASAALTEFESSLSDEVKAKSSINRGTTVLPQWCYRLSSVVLCAVALALLIGLNKVTVGETFQRPAPAAPGPVMKNILLGNPENVNGVRLLAMEARFASAASAGISPEKLAEAKHCLVVAVTLQNTMRDKDVYLAHLWDDSGLVDDLGNRLKRLAYRVRPRNKASANAVTGVLKPSEIVDTTIIFESPVADAGAFVMTFRPGLWLEEPDGYDPVSGSLFNLEFARTEIVRAANR